MAVESILRAATPQFEMLEDALFDGLRMEQADRVHGTALAESIDPADALLEPQRIPRQLEIDHDAAAMMKIEALTRGVGGDQHINRALVERVDGGSAEIGRHTAVNRGCSPRRGQRLQHRVEAVAVFGEDHHRFAKSLEQARDPEDLRAARALPRQPNQSFKAGALFGRVLQARRRQCHRRLHAIGVIVFVPWQQRL